MGAHIGGYRRLRQRPVAVVCGTPITRRRHEPAIPLPLRSCEKIPSAIKPLENGALPASIPAITDFFAVLTHEL